MKKAISYIVDQGVFSFTNFLVMIFLARHMSSQDFSIFASLFSLVILAMTVHMAFSVEPAIIKDVKTDHLFKEIKSGIRSASLIALFISCASFFAFVDSLIISFLLFLYSISMCLVIYIRRVSQAHSIKNGKFISLIFSFFQASGFGYLLFNQRLDLSSVLLTVAMPGILSVLPVLAELFIRRARFTSWDGNYSKFSYQNMSAAFMAWPIINIYYFALVGLGDNNGAAELRVLTTLLMPVNQVVSLMSFYYMKSQRGVAGISTRYFLFINIVSAVYGLAILFFWLGGLDSLVFEGKYDIESTDIVLLILYMILFNYYTCFSSALKSSMNGVGMLMANAFGLLACLILFYPAVVLYSAKGALAVMSCCLGVMLMVSLRCVYARS